MTKKRDEQAWKLLRAYLMHTKETFSNLSNTKHIMHPHRQASAAVSKTYDHCIELVDQFNPHNKPNERQA